ncbi:hypothetical protein F4778DRAFT_785243 [Xylariomycetidae sp. FL2044]|nr:hypothetical protein F4778DRAFT_785243 [Xylariomycetidae sp. FL2044]
MSRCHGKRQQGSNRKAEDKVENIMLQPMGAANQNDNMSSLSDEGNDVQKSSTLGVVPIDPFGTLSTMPNAVALCDYLAAHYYYHQDMGGAPQPNLVVHFNGPVDDDELSHNIPIVETFLQSLEETPGAAPEGTPGAAALEGINNHNQEFLALRGINSELTNQALYELTCSARDDLQLFDSFPAGEFKPFYFFFYGSLMDVKQLAEGKRQRVLVAELSGITTHILQAIVQRESTPGEPPADSSWDLQSPKGSLEIQRGLSKSSSPSERSPPKYPVEDLQLEPRDDYVRPALKFMCSDPPEGVVDSGARNDNLLMKSIGPLLETWARAVKDTGSSRRPFVWICRKGRPELGWPGKHPQPNISNLSKVNHKVTAHHIQDGHYF